MPFHTIRYRRWVRRRCQHPQWRLECLHDEHLRGRWYFWGFAAQCLECGKYVRFRPVVCSWTGEKHPF